MYLFEFRLYLFKIMEINLKKNFFLQLQLH